MEYDIEYTILLLNVLPGRRQIVNIRVDRADKHTVLTFCPVPKD